jgi:predicted amidophosphoribosyltransferase
MRDVILRLKYGGLKACGVLLGRGLGECFENPGLDALVPVPLHLDSPRRYNQTEEIALGLGDVWGVPVWRAARWRSRSKTQESKGAAARRALSSDAFEIDESVKGLRLALVDDVCTTGSTLARMAEACRLKGARVVGAFVPAQTATAKE